MNFYSKEMMLFLVQIDHLSGEILGDVIDSFYSAGAKNVQILNSITKKNRPSHVLLIDAPLQAQEEVEFVILNECGSSGWHCIRSCHRYTDVSIVTKEITVRTKDSEFSFAAKGKMIGDDRKNIRPEYDSCVELKGLLRQEGNTYVSVKELQTALADVFHNEDLCELFFG